MIKGNDIIDRIKQREAFVGNAMHIPPAAQARARRLCWQFNNTPPDDAVAQHNILNQLLGDYHSQVYLMPHFHCDFGFNIHFTGFALVNYDCTFLDTSPITIGRSVLIGPGTVLACPGHPMHPEQRQSSAFETSAPSQSRTTCGSELM